MKYFLFSLMFLCFISCKKEEETANPNLATIEDNFVESITQAKSKDKNVCLMVHASWCSVCKSFISGVLRDGEVTTHLNNGFVFSKIDGDMTYGKPFATRFGVTGFPTFIILDKNENVLVKRAGQMSKSQFIEWSRPFIR